MATDTLPTTPDYYALSGLLPDAYATGRIGSIVHKPDCVTVEGAGGSLTLYWDTSDGDNAGWAWRLRGPEGAEESGPLDSLAEARRLAARVLGRSSLAATNNTDGWCVRDSDGGVWWPDTTAQRAIEAAPDPAALAVDLCHRSPMRGTWAD